MHVYKLDTGNHPSQPTTTKKIIIQTLGSLLRRSKTIKQNNHNHKPNKEDTKQVVLETSRKSLPAIKDGRKSASVIEEAKKVIEVKGGRRSAENRAEMVMINVGEVAELYHVRVLVTDMPAFMQVHAFRCARRTFESLDNKSCHRQIAFNMKKVRMYVFCFRFLQVLMRNVRVVYGMIAPCPPCVFRCLHSQTSTPSRNSVHLSTWHLCN